MYVILMMRLTAACVRYLGDEATAARVRYLDDEANSSVWVILMRPMVGRVRYLDEANGSVCALS